MDPLTIALLTAQAAAGVSKSVYGVNQMAKAKQAYNQIEEAPTGSISEYAQAVKEAKKGEAATRRLEEINRTMGTATSAAATDPRLSGALGDIVRAGSEQKTKAIGAQEQNYLNALIRKGGAEERRNRMLYDREFREKGLAQRGFEAGTQNLISGIGDISSSIAYGASLDKDDPSGAGLDNNARAQNLTAQTQDDIFKDAFKDTPSSSMPGMQPIPNLGEEFEAEDFVPDIPFDQELKRLQEEERQRLAEAQKAAQNMYNRGGAVETPGPFSHSRNPIYMMDKKGNLVGEMTGGEYIFNPEQAEDLYELAQTGNTQLHKFVRNMLNKSNFK